MEHQPLTWWLRGVRLGLQAPDAAPVDLRVAHGTGLMRWRKRPMSTGAACLSSRAW
jgi:hypothetical protein